ncbi:MAG: DUF2284 domain-containing protein [Deltaproteobacteria bacterium]|jgi:predicted metal-binding protein|nr:DUF2284 domain-containing protein [Deltaproteobacteria bacterium]
MTDFSEDRLADLAVALGANSWAFINVVDITFRDEFRKLCEANRCGSYDRGWMCPPAVGALEDLIADLKRRSRAMVFTSASQLENSFDFKGMVKAGDVFAQLVQNIAARAAQVWPEFFILVLGAGPCKVCRKCAYPDGDQCRHPEQAVRSLESNGVDVGQLAKLTGLKYNNGPGTVTYFGAVFFNPGPVQ